MASTYDKSGVNIDAGNDFVKNIKSIVKKTYSRNVLDGVGGFGSLFKLPKNFKNPILVSSTDGVGTKLNIAFLANKFDTIGLDLVGMCVNDIIVYGAKPLFLLDYYATSKLNLSQAETFIQGVVKGCQIAGCSLVGGETAEMAGFYKKGEFDCAGFVVGIAEKNKLITGKKIKEGDILIGLQSSGLHSNGYSLVRHLLFKKSKFSVNTFVNELGCNLGEELLRPTIIYVPVVQALLKKIELKGIAHITGGGLTENLPRIFPKGFSARVHLNSWQKPLIFSFLQNTYKIDEREMLRVFNNGIGMVVIVDKKDVSSAMKIATHNKLNSYVIGIVIKSKGVSRVIYG